MPIPNNSPATAIEILAADLPATTTLDMSELDPSDGAWYKLVIPAGMYYIGIRIPQNYTYVNGVLPYTNFGATWTGLAATYTSLIQQPTTPGDTYYFQFLPTGSPPPSTDGSFVLTGCPTTSPVLGNVLIPDDTAGFPGLIFGSDGTVITSVGIVATGEGGDVVANGRMMVDQKTSHDLKTYDGYTYTLVATTSNPVSGSGVNIQSDQVSKFYVSKRDITATNPTVYVYDSNGTLETSFTLDGAGTLGRLCPNSGGTILYYAQTGANVPVKRWDITNDVALSDLVAAVASYAIDDIIVLGNGTIAVVYVASGSPHSGYISIYNAAGTLVDSLNPAFDGSTLFYDHICRSLLNDDYYHLRLLGSDNNVISAIDSTDGSTVATFTSIIFVDGVSQDNTTTQNFGANFSCPIIPVPASTPAPPTLPGTTTYPIRRLRRTPTIFADGKRVFHRRLQIEVQPGIGTVETPAPLLLVRTSDDGGLTWSNTRELSPGETGQFQRLMRLYALGSAYNRCYDVIVSDPVQWGLIQAFLDMDGGRF